MFLAVVAAPITAWGQTSEQVKPYILLVLDISGSMDGATGQGAPSCGGTDTKFDHAKCAIQKLVNTHGDIVFGLSQFRNLRAVDDVGSACDEGGGVDCNNSVNCSACDTSNGTGCDACMSSAERFELLVPLVEDNANSVLSWVDFSGGTCTFDPASDPELSSAGWTPIGGSLRGAKRYFQGADPYYATDLDPIYGPEPGDPIRNDPYKDVFVGGQQCRPYIVISLTDGDETCEIFNGGTTAAASALLTTDVDGQTYRVETKAIGFGKSPGDTQIEGIAHAGGAADGPGNEGFYAQNETELSIAFNQIIQDSIKVEVCNGIDDDCDGNVDEGYQLYCDLDGVFGMVESNAVLCMNPGDDCDGSDDNCAMGVTDEPTNACGLCGPTPTEECNLLDDDCDNSIDEGGVCGDCVPQGAEVCNNNDDDCDGSIDEGLVRDCGTDVGECAIGTETCTNGMWGGCDAVTGVPEICDDKDNDCDGVVDGFAEECYSLPGNGPPFDGVCQPGTRVCRTGGGGMFDACLGEIGPSAEACDLKDNDCDGTVDEDTGGADCSTACGPGTTSCVNGVLECSSSSTATDEVCNNIDDDCNGLVDDMVTDPEIGMDCTDGGLCVPGSIQCVNGALECVGGVEPGLEICDCEDNDCDGQTDEEPPALCQSGASCVACQCAFPCADNEFPCPAGRVCVDNFCLIDTCYGVECPPLQDGTLTTCEDGECVPICDTVTCADPLVCRGTDGTCQPDDCRGFPERCSETELCLAGECVSDPCAGVDCPGEDQYCLAGECVSSCAGVECPAGSECKLGECAESPCDETCPSGEVCYQPTGQCVPDPCRGVVCQQGQACDSETGECGQDPCLGVECPGDQICRDGSCYEPGQVDMPDAGPPPDYTYVAPGGGGGCDAGGRAGGLGWLFVLAVLLLIVRRRQSGTEVQ